MFFKEETVINRFSEEFSKMRAARRPLKGLIDKLESSWPEQWAVVGGGVRDLFFGNRPNDIDILVNTALEDLEEKILGTFEVKDRTKFDGIKLDGDIPVDIWTVGPPREYKNNTLEMWNDCALFNIDACLVNPNGFGSVEKMCEGFREGVISLNAHTYPDKTSAAIRAFRLSHKYNLELGESIKKLLREAQNNDNR